ncbi:unnamed protein product [Leptosia nina]|uniref:Inosine/uridine-preferring nucleoside hydrolase domain-containing protein n=1 Tax=Leptosia nina TaxID=320188 RepID=A0AAV1JJF7_9NEOP
MLISLNKVLFLVSSAISFSIEKDTIMDKWYLVIDNDAGGDDALGIFLAVLFEKHYNGPQLIGLTTVHGNAEEENVYINNQRVLKLAKRQDVPIYRGSNTSIVFKPPPAFYYGADGLGELEEELANLVPANKKNAVDALLDLSREYNGKLIVVTTGPVTNVGFAVKRDPDFLSRLKHLYVAAGHIYSEEYPKGEFNARSDAEAYRLITENATPDKVTVFPFSQVKTSLNISKEWRVNTFGALQSEIVKAQNMYERISLTKNDRWHALDPAAVAIALKPDLVREYKYSQNDILLEGDKRGINKNTFVDKDEANVRVVFSVKEDDYKTFLLDLFSK